MKRRSHRLAPLNRSGCSSAACVNPARDKRLKTSRKLATDRWGYFDNAFNVVNLGVNDGVVTLSGQMANYAALNSAPNIMTKSPWASLIALRRVAISSASMPSFRAANSS